MNATATASTGVKELDDALGGLFWGDNVVWEIEDGESLDPFVDALVGVRTQFSNAAFVTLTEEPGAIRAAHPGFDVLDARAGTRLAQPGPLLTAARAFAQQAPHTLLVFDSLDAMSEQWDRGTAQKFFMRACPTLLDLWAIAYWSLTPGRHSPLLRQAVDAITQCVVVIGDGRLRIAKAEGRPSGVQGSVFRWRQEADGGVWERAPAAARLGVALRALRIQRHLSQAELAQVAGVSASAISQVERGRRGFSLDTLLTLTARLNITLDELLRGEIALGYRLARRTEPDDSRDRLLSLLDDPQAGLRTSVSRLAPGKGTIPRSRHDGIELIAVAAGLVQVVLPTGRPVLRQGEVLLAEWSGVTSWHNVGDRDAVVFWVLRDDVGPSHLQPT